MNVVENVLMRIAIRDGGFIPLAVTITSRCGASTVTSATRRSGTRKLFHRPGVLAPRALVLVGFEDADLAGSRPVVNALATSCSIASLARVATRFLPWKDDSGNANDFRFDVKAGDVFLDLFRVELANMIARRTSPAASGLIQASRAQETCRDAVGAGKLAGSDHQTSGKERA